MTRTRHPEHHGHRDHDRRASGADAQNTSGDGYARLKVKIEETFSSLFRSSANDDGEASVTPDFEGVFQAKLKLSGPDGKLEAKLKLRFDGDSADSAADFASVIQSFTQTLFAALRTLYGAEPSSTPSPAGLPVATAPIGSVINSPAAAPAPAPTGTPTPAPRPPATPAPTGAAAPTPAPVPAPIPAPPASGTAASPTNPPAAAPSPSGTAASASQSTGSLVIKLRLTYDAFESNLGPLVNQLAQPSISDAFPQLASLLKDLADRFGQLLSKAQASGTATDTAVDPGTDTGTGTGNSPLSLAQFLTALSRSFAVPLPEPEPDPTVAIGSEAPENATLPATTPTTPSATPDTTPATTTDAADAAVPTDATPTAARRYTATAQYEQVLSYSANGSSFSLQASLRERVVYEVA